MGGSTTLGMGVGSVGLGWSQIGSASLGELHSYPAVTRLQRQLNGVKAFYGDWHPGSDILVDGTYADETHTRLRSFISWATRRVPPISECSLAGTGELDRAGPAQVAACMNRALFGDTGLSSSELSQIQQAFNEWKALPVRGAGGGLDPYASSRTACAASGGTWDNITHTCTPAPTAEEGLSTGMWILLALVGAAVAYGLWYVVTED